MSRSYGASEDGYSRYSASSPMSYAEDEGPSEPGMRPMRLKVLYTCDDKANCMAKWYQIVHVRTAFLDEKTEVGVIELRTCIKAIVTCSPELVAKLGQDYTVYAYDYSEYETPLVGQGMLSWVLASASPTPSAPAQQSSTMVTGRVTKNVKALFSRDSIADTLEVKLRLVPVPTVLQSEYIESMKRYRDISRLMPDHFDHQGWTDFLKANPQVLSMLGPGRVESPQNGHNKIGNMGIEQVQRLMHRTHNYSQTSQGTLSRRDSFTGSVTSRDSSRVGSPTHSQINAQDHYTEHFTRPASRNSTHSTRRSASHENIEDPGFVSNDEGQEEGPARKRARTTQVKRPRKSDVFGTQVDSLRVAASGAASVRVLQPAAIRPGAIGPGSLEKPQRAPTPVPQRTGLIRGRPVAQPRRSGLGQMVSNFPSSDHGPVFHDSGRPSESALLSPEAQSTIASSPGEDPGSSPPVPLGQCPPEMPSSPQLPRLPPPHEDSGFMSGPVEDDYMDDRQPKQSVETEQFPRESESVSNAQTKPVKGRRAATKRPRADSTTAQMTPEEKAAEISRRNARRAIGWRRIQSWTEGQSSDGVAQSSEAQPAPEDSKTQPSEADRPKTKQSYDRDHQKGLIQGRLANAIEAGELPPFCENCGDINTPTWRKAWARTYSGAPDNVVLSKEPGGVVAIQVVEQDSLGQITLFRTIKKSLLDSDESFNQMLLCNPCGLWLVNRKQMRPPERWNSHDKKKKSEPRSGTGRSRQKSVGRGRSATALPSEATEPPSEMSLRPYESRIDPRLTGQYTGLPHTDIPEQEEEPRLPQLPEEPVRPASKGNVQSRSDGSVPVGAVAALQRAIQSSPTYTGGSKHSPIEVDTTTPDRTRRTLFPSPRKAGALGVTSGNAPKHSLQNSPDAPRQYTASKLAITGAAHDKENVQPADDPQPSGRPTTPSPGDVDYFHDLFNDPKAPATPSRSNNVSLPMPKSPSNLFKTPSKQTPHRPGTGDFFSSAAKAFLHPPRTPSRTPSRKSAETPNAETPFTRHINQLLSEPMDGFDMTTSPGALFADFGHGMADFGMSTDMPMPSSPPVGAGLTKSRQVEDWSELGFNSSPFKDSPFKTSNARATADDGHDDPANRAT